MEGAEAEQCSALRFVEKAARFWSATALRRFVKPLDFHTFLKRQGTAALQNAGASSQFHEDFAASNYGYKSNRTLPVILRFEFLGKA